MKVTFNTKNVATALVAGILSGAVFSATAATTGKTLPTEPYVVDGYTADTRTAEAKETYANRVTKSDVEGNNHSVFGQDNTVLAEHGSSSNFGNQNVIGVNAKDGNIFGDGSSITGLQAQAYGDNNHLKGEQNSAFGMNNIVTGNHTHAIGGGNNVTGDQATAVGHYNLITGANTVAIGYDNKALQNEGIVIGSGAKSDGLNASAYGSKTIATGESALAVGTGAHATNDTTVAVGNDSNATAKSSVALGGSTNATGVYSTAVGDSATAEANGSVAISVDSKAKGVNSMALGRESVTTHDNSVALGSHSVSKLEKPVTTATVGKLTYDGFAGTNPMATVSVGTEGKERQVVNVAAGEISATSTDAINGSQLYATNDVINNVAGSITTVLGGNAQVDSKGNITMTDIGGTGENTVHDAIKSHTDKIAANAEGVKTNAKGIADNARNIATNTADIRAAEALIDTNAKDIATNAKAIEANKAGIEANTNYIKAVEQKLPEVKAGENTTVDVTVDANGKAVYTVSSKDFQPAIDAVDAKTATNAKAIEANKSAIAENAKGVKANAEGVKANAEGVKANTAKIQEVEKEAKRHSVVKSGQNVQVTKEFGENGEAVYTVGVETNHLATKAEVNKHIGAINDRIDGVEGKVAQNTKDIRKLDRDVRKNRKRADAGIASVAAMANIPQVYLPGKSGVGVGVGHKHGQSALAIGYSRTSDNAHHIIKLSAGVDSQKDVTVGAGYMYQW